MKLAGTGLIKGLYRDDDTAKSKDSEERGKTL
jgi:hypothetical protein